MDESDDQTGLLWQLASGLQPSVRIFGAHDPSFESHVGEIYPSNMFQFSLSPKTGKTDSKIMIQYGCWFTQGRSGWHRPYPGLGSIISGMLQIRFPTRR